MKKVMYVLILLLVVVSGLLFASREVSRETAAKPIPRPLSAAEQKAAMEDWEATPAGKNFKNWEGSPEGKKVLAGAAKIKAEVSAAANMEAVVTALSLPPGSRLGFGVMVRINDEDYILSFGPEQADELKQLQSLKVNEKIIIRSHFVSYAPKYAYPIITGDYVERDHTILYKRAPRKEGC